MFVATSRHCNEFLSARTLLLLVLLSATCLLPSCTAFDDEPEDHHHEAKDHNEGPLPKDKVLLRGVKTLTFQRNKRTTSRRTHPIHQLSCVGGTAGCKLFTPNLVECENTGFNQDKAKLDWRCHADINERVRFNHVEVICEGYDYPEDDYILLGSCGLEFTLDYADPADHHHQSYFKHMDEHEKELHRKRSGHPKPQSSPSAGLSNFLGPIFTFGGLQTYLVGVFLILALCSFLLVRYFSAARAGKPSTKAKRPNASYGPLASAVLTTKKAC